MAEEKRDDKQYWSYSCGRRGVNRVRVYERSVSPVLYVEWHWRGQRVQRSLKSETGHPVTDKTLAKDIAHEISRNLKQHHNRAARERILGVTGERTLGELLRRLHEARTWKDSGPERFRRFWIRELGKDTLLTDISPAMVEAAGSPEWSARTLRHYRSYLVGAYKYAEEKLKWIGPADNLSAVDLPKVKSRSVAYTLAEVQRLLPALEAEDERAGWIGYVAFQTGRRLTAIRTLKKAAVELHADHAVLHFPAETDKAGKEGSGVVVGHALTLTRRLMDRPGKYVLGTSPPSKELPVKGWLPRAEARAGIAHVSGRGIHGLKRRYATETRGLVGRDKQAGTREHTLEGTYVQDDLAPKLQVARSVSAMLTVSPSGSFDEKGQK